MKPCQPAGQVQYPVRALQVPTCGAGRAREVRTLGKILPLPSCQFYP